jgi:hypothetical protein
MPRGYHNLKFSDEQVNAIFEKNHGEEEREYYAPVRSAIGSTLSPDVRPGFTCARRLRTSEGESLY